MATLLEIRDRIRERTDHEHTGEEFVTGAELNKVINRSRLELFGMLVNYGLHTVSESETTISPDGSATYALPADFYAAQGVWRENNGYFYRLKRHGARTKPYNEVRSDAYSYRIFGYRSDAVIEFYPRPDTGSYVVRYIPVPSDLVNDTDVVDGVLGWEEFIVADVSVYVYTKEKLDPSVHAVKKNELIARIKMEARNRDLLEVQQVGYSRDRRADSLYDDNGFLPGGYRGVFPYYGSF